MSSVRSSRWSASRWSWLIQPPPTSPRRSVMSVGLHLCPVVVAEDPRQQEWCGLLELVVAAGFGRLVGTPALERRRMAEAGPLEVVVGDLGDALDAKRLP